MVSSIKQDELAFYLAEVKVQARPILASERGELISLIDLTRLNETDTEEGMASFCLRAATADGWVAALCVYPRFVKQVAVFLKTSPIKLATVVNFPQGGSPLSAVLEEIKHSLDDGAQEIDLVFPYQAYLGGEREAALAFVSRCKEACGSAILKVILETGIIREFNLIAEVTRGVVLAGADFIKTSTGKLPQGASLEAAAVILLTLRELIPSVKRTLGFKAAGGLSDPWKALQYLALAKNIMGLAWPSPQTFRLGASQLLEKLT